MLDDINPTDTYSSPPFDTNGALSIRDGATYIRDTAKNIVEDMVTRSEFMPDRFNKEIHMVMSVTVDMVTTQALVDSMLGPLFDIIKIADPTDSIRSVVDTRKKYICKPATHKLPNVNPARGTAVSLTRTVTLDGTAPLIIESEAIPKSFFTKLRDLIIKLNALSPDHPAHNLIYKNEDPRTLRLSEKANMFLQQLLTKFQDDMVTQLEILRGALDSGVKIAGIVNLLTYCAPGFLIPDTRVCGAMSRTHDERIREIISDSLAESMFCLDKTVDTGKVVGRWIEIAERNTDNDRSREGRRATIVVHNGPEQGTAVDTIMIVPIDTFTKKISPLCHDRQLRVTMPVCVVGIDWDTHTSQHCFSAPNGSVVQKTKGGTVEEFSDQNPPMVDPNPKVNIHTAPCLMYRGKVVPVICKDLEQSKEMNQVLTQTWSMDFSMINNVIPALLNADRNCALDLFHPANGMATIRLTNILENWQGCGPTTTVYSSGTQSKRSAINGRALARIMEECVMSTSNASIADHVMAEHVDNKPNVVHAVNEVLTAQRDGCFLQPHGTLSLAKHPGGGNNHQQLAFLPAFSWQGMNYVNNVITIANVLTLMKRNVQPSDDRPGITLRKRIKLWQKQQEQQRGEGYSQQQTSEYSDSSVYMQSFQSTGTITGHGSRKRRQDLDDLSGEDVTSQAELSEMEFLSLHCACQTYLSYIQDASVSIDNCEATEPFKELLKIVSGDTESSASSLYNDHRDTIVQYQLEHDMVHQMCQSFAKTKDAMTKLVMNQARVGVQSSDRSKKYDEINYQIFLAMLNEMGGDGGQPASEPPSSVLSRQQVGCYWLVYLFTVSPYTKDLFRWMASHDLLLGVGCTLLRGESGLCENAVLAKVGGMRGLFGVTRVRDYNNGNETATLGPDGGDAELTMEASLEVGFADNSFQIPGVTMIAAHKVSDDFSRIGSDVFVPNANAVNYGWTKMNNRQFMAVLCPPIMDVNHMSDMYNPMGRNMMDTNTHVWGDLIPASSTANVENFYPAVFGYRTHNPYGLRGGVALMTHIGTVRDGYQYKDPDLSLRRDGAAHVGGRNKQVEIPLNNYVRSTDAPTPNQAARMQSAKNQADQVYSPFVGSALISRLVDYQISLGNPTDHKTLASRLEGMFKNSDRIDMTQISAAFGCAAMAEFATSPQELENYQSKMMSAKLATAQAYGASEAASTLEHVQRQRFYVDVARGFQIYCTGSAMTRTYDQRVYMSQSYSTR